MLFLMLHLLDFHKQNTKREKLFTPAVNTNVNSVCGKISNLNTFHQQGYI